MKDENDAVEERMRYILMKLLSIRAARSHSLLTLPEVKMPIFKYGRRYG